MGNTEEANLDGPSHLCIQRLYEMHTETLWKTHKLRQNIKSKNNTEVNVLPNMTCGY